MEQKLKERLIGTAAITVLAAVFLPMLIDDDDQRWVKQESVSDVPPLPAKYKQTPKIVNEADFDDSQLFPDSNQSVDNIGKSQSARSKPVDSGRTTTSVVPVIEKPVLGKKLPATRTPDMKKQLDSLLPSTAKSSRPTSTKQASNKSKQVAQAPVQKPVVAKPKPPVKKASATHKKAKSITRQKQSTASSVAISKSKKANSAKPDQTGLWIIQVGVFKDKSNANVLMQKLKKNGFAAYLEPVTTEVGKLIRVRAGRVPKEKTARQMVSTLNKRLRLKAITFPETKWNSMRAGR